MALKPVGINDDGSFVGRAADWLNATFAVVPVASFGLANNGLASAFAAAVAEAPERGTLLIPPGFYEMDAPLENSGKSISVIARGARFTLEDNMRFASWTGGFETQYTISGITTTEITPPSGNARDVTVITLSGSPDWAHGDVVKVFSNDIIAEGRTPSDGEAGRHGEFATVYSVSGSDVVLTGLLREEHSSAPRVQRLSDTTVRWEGGSFYAGDAAFSNRNTAGVMRFLSLRNPIVSNFRIERAPSIGIEMRSCYYPIVDRCDVDYLADDTSGGIAQLGYAVNDVSCEGLIFRDSVIRNVRHAHTDDTLKIVEDYADAAFYGRSYNGRISNVTAVGATSNAFSPHHYGEGHIYFNCTAVGPFANGWGIRGINHQVIDCVTEDTYSGVTNLREGGGQTYGTVVKNLRSKNVQQAHVSDYNYTDTDVFPEHVYSMTVDGGNFGGAGSTALWVTNGHMRVVGHVVWTAPEDVADGSAAVQNNGGLLHSFGEIELDYRGNMTGDDLSAVRMWGGPPVATEIHKIRVRNEGASDRFAEAIFDGTGSSGNMLWRIFDAVFDVEPDTYFPVSNHSSANSRLSWRTADHQKGTQIRVVEDADVSNAGVYLRRVPSLITILRCEGTSSSNRTLGNLREAAIHGAQVVVSWVSPLGGTLTVKNDPGSYGVDTGLGTDIVLASGGQITLFYDGTVWRPVNQVA